MASTRIRVTNNMGEPWDLTMRWFIFNVTTIRVERGATVEFPCEWVWYDFTGNINNGAGGIPLNSGVYGGSDIELKRRY